MVSKVSIISEAFLLLGQSRPINDLNDTPQTTAASSFYDTLYPQLLTTHPWRFAMRLRELNQLTQKPILDRWRFAYQLPADLLNPYRLHPPNNNYSIYEDEIFSNFDNPLILEYTARVEPARFPHYFTVLLIYTIAAHMGMMVTQQEAIVELWVKKADEQLVVSRTLDSQAQPSPVIADNSIFASHFVTGTTGIFGVR